MKINLFTHENNLQQYCFKVFKTALLDSKNRIFLRLKAILF